jgi:hypothetical protein
MVVALLFMGASLWFFPDKKEGVTHRCPLSRQERVGKDRQIAASETGHRITKAALP